MAVSDISGTSIFYEDNVTGQNNSLLSGFKTADAVAKSHYEKLSIKKNTVDVITIDDYIRIKNMNVQFIKIDIEGYELQALKGMKETLKKVQKMMIEVTLNQSEVSTILKNNSFEIRSEHGEVFEEIPNTYCGNLFVLKNNNE